MDAIMVQLVRQISKRDDPLLRSAIADRWDELGESLRAEAIKRPCIVQNLGTESDALTDDGFPLARFVRLAYEYQDGDHYGSGRGLALRIDGLFEIANLGHCSCYGPTQEWHQDKPEPLEWAEVLRRAGPEEDAIGGDDSLWKLIHYFQSCNDIIAQPYACAPLARPAAEASSGGDTAPAPPG